MKMFSQINWNLLPMKAHYFLFNIGTGPIVPFLSVYAKQLGFSSVIVGLIYTILPICGMLIKPIAGLLADWLKSQKKILLIGILLCATGFLSLKFTPEIPAESNVHFSCEGGDSVFDNSIINSTIDDCLVKNLQSSNEIVNCSMNCKMNDNYWKIIINNNNWKPKNNSLNNLLMSAHVNVSKTMKYDEMVVFYINNVTMMDGTVLKLNCPQHISTICSLNCNKYEINDLVKIPTMSDSEAYGQYQFWVFLFLMIFTWMSQAIVVSLADTICFEMLEDRPHLYGYQRMFGALGWGLIAIIAGIMVDSFSDGSSQKDYSSAFYLAVAGLLADFLVSSQLKYTQKKHSSNILLDIGRILASFRVIVFLIWCIFMGMCTGLIWNFLMWLVEDLAKKQGCDSNNWIKTLEGLLMAVQTLGGELPFFFLSGWILKRIGHVNAMTLISLVIGIRYILYSIITNPWYFLPIELLNGISFGLFYACMASYASIVAPTGAEATMQGMVGAIFEGAGVSLGSFIAGHLFSLIGGPWTFRLFGIGSLIVGVLHAIIQFFIKPREYEEPNSIPDAFDYISEDDQDELTKINY